MTHFDILGKRGGWGDQKYIIVNNNNNNYIYIIFSNFGKRKTFSSYIYANPALMATIIIIIIIIITMMMMMHERGWEMFVLDETDRQTDKKKKFKI